MNGLWGKVRDFVGLNESDGLEDLSDLGGQEDMQSGYESQPRRTPTLNASVGSGFESEEEMGDFGASNRSWRTETERRRRAGEWSDPTPRRPRERSMSSSVNSNVIGLPNVNQTTSEVIVIEPRGFDEMAQVVIHLRDRKSVIMNLTLMEPADAQRSVDFVAGGTFAIDGHQERIGENIFLFTPSCVAVTTQNQAQTPSVKAAATIPTPIWSNAYADTVAVGQR